MAEATARGEAMEVLRETASTITFVCFENE